MKHLALVLGLCLALGTGSGFAKTKDLAENKSVETVLSTKDAKKVKEKMLMDRLHAIHGIATKGNLSGTEKAGLKKEVKDIERELKKMQGFYVYLSLTAIVIILILLLLL